MILERPESTNDTQATRQDGGDGAPTMATQPFPAPSAGPVAWREEVASRVEGFRRRRARLQGEETKDENLNFDFDVAESAEEGAVRESDDSALESSAAPQTSFADINLGHEDSTAAGNSQFIGSEELQDQENAQDASRREVEPLEILLESPTVPEEANIANVGPFPWPVAPTASRFVAGLLDALILFGAGALFSVIFLIAHGRLAWNPLNAAVIAFIGVFFVMLYFGVFTGFTYSTPGLLWKGLEVRTFDGRYPSSVDSFWRAFGYLISASALMMGFVWVLVDGDRLTWHDRMSRTFVTEANATPQEPEL